jgi:hypothetical protein
MDWEGVGLNDQTSVLREIKDKQPDAFVGITYSSDTILASKQANEIGSTRSSLSLRSEPPSHFTSNSSGTRRKAWLA